MNFIIIKGANFLYASLHFCDFHLLGWNFVDTTWARYYLYVNDMKTAKSDHIKLDVFTVHVILL